MAETITCADPTTHFDSGCALLNHYDTDNDGILKAVDALLAQNDGMTSEEVDFILAASTSGSINALCPGCYTAPEPPEEKGTPWLLIGVALLGIYLIIKNED